MTWDNPRFPGKPDYSLLVAGLWLLRRWQKILVQGNE